MCGATHLPVTVKVRSGWDEVTRDAVTIARRCRDAGARALTLHPRTRTQMFDGRACWEEIAAVVAAVDVPVIGNGDIKSAEDACRMWRETGCAGIMIARGSFGNPWIFQQARDLLEGRVARPAPETAERFSVLLRHVELQRSIQGDHRRAAIEFRKHLSWYVRGMPGAVALRRELQQVQSLDEIAGLLRCWQEPALAVG